MYKRNKLKCSRGTRELDLFSCTKVTPNTVGKRKQLSFTLFLCPRQNQLRMDNDIRQFDNINNKVVDDLKCTIQKDGKIAVAAACFSIYAFEALKKELQTIEQLRFIFTSPTFTKEKPIGVKREFFIPKLNRERSLYGSDFEIRLRNQLSQKAIARECADWIRRKVKFKSNVSENVLNGFMNVSGERGNCTYLPFNEFTTTELGCEKGNNLCQVAMKLPAPFADKYMSEFDELWNDNEKFKDVTDVVIENIETVYKENSPEFIYFVTLYNIFNEFLEDISEDVLPNEATGFKNSLIWNKLYGFQKDACLAIINKLEKYNGCILADSVGLGKTFTALSVIKYYEGRNRSVLVLCPKKLNDNWITYKSNYKNNPIAGDRLRYDIFFHSDLSRNSGKSNGQELSHINWGNYDLVVIDESHNFRNGGKISTDENDENPRENRYLQLMNKVIRKGVKTKVLMLSATPVNNRFNDLKNQLALAYEGKTENINGLLGEKANIDIIFRNAQTAYMKWSKLPTEQRTTKELLDRLSIDFFELLDAVTIARSRRHIEKYYNSDEIGKFPTRLAPISRRPQLTDLEKGKTLTFKEIAEQLNMLNLSIYTPSNYIYPSCLSKYAADGNDPDRNLSMAGREKGIRKLMAINMLKRLESSVNSFRMTLNRIMKLIESTLETIDSFEKNGGNENKKVDVQDFANADDFDFEESEDDIFIGGKKTQILLQDIDYISWKTDLKSDLEIFKLLLLILKDITPEHDSKLQCLITDIKHKLANPINGENKKILIFTAFADTADYLYNQLAEKIHEHTGLHVGMITGTIDGRCTIKKPSYKIDFNTLLTLFSPVSKERDVLLENVKDEIDILIATDCISEGQNLQDCDYLINYDIHWNPVRIIQRFGRIDRIGSKNDVIQLVNYWPDIELDDYIKLKGRVEARMKATVLTSTGDDNLLIDSLSTEEKGDLDYRRQQLERMQKEVVDLEDMDTGINIMDLGLNEFRLDLLSYMKENPDVANTPFGMNAVVGSNENVSPGVIFVLKNRNNGVNIDRQNLLHPFYMVFIGDDGTVMFDHLQPKKILDSMRSVCKGNNLPIKELSSVFNKETHDGKLMTHYSDLLQSSIRSIIDVREESDIESLFSLGETTALRGEIKGLDDFELICFLVIK